MLMRVVRLLGILALVWSVPAFGQSTPSPAADWVAAVRAGGHVVGIRHGATRTPQPDVDPLNLRDTSKQRQLTDEGRAQAKSIGESMRKLKIPVGQVQTSLF